MLGVLGQPRLITGVGRNNAPSTKRVDPFRRRDSAVAFAKRKAPSPVPPVVWQGVEYRAPLGVEHMGHVQAFELSSHRELWETKVYHVWTVPLLEEDNQWIFVSGMRVQNGKLLVSNEAGKSYRLDLRTGRIV